MQSLRFTAIALVLGYGLGPLAVAAEETGAATPASDGALTQSQPQPARSKLSITIYNNGMALVLDTRTLDLPRGRSRQEFKDVSAAIRPETVSLTAPGLSTVEQNFDFDLLTPENLMAKEVGQTIQIVRVIPGTGAQTTESATVLSVNNGVVLKIGNHIEVLHSDEIPTRVIFNKIPDNLRAQPTLSVTFNADQAGLHETNLSYLTTGLSWQANYVALLDEKAGKLNLQGWITLTNSSGTTFNNAQTYLVAGDVSISGQSENDFNRPRNNGGPRRLFKNDGEANSTTSLTDYYLYPLPERTTIADQQTKQVGFLDASNIPAQKTYAYSADGTEGGPENEHADVVVQFNNANSGLGAPLPAGVVRVYARDNKGIARFIGENSIGHTPTGSALAIKIGKAFDVTVQRTLTSVVASDKHHSEYSMQYQVHNSRDQPITLSISQRGIGGDAKITKESLPSVRVDAYSLKWDVPVAANDNTTLTFTVNSTH